MLGPYTLPKRVFFVVPVETSHFFSVLDAFPLVSVPAVVTRPTTQEAHKFIKSKVRILLYTTSFEL